MSGLFSWSGSSMYPEKPRQVMLHVEQLLSLATGWQCWPVNKKRKRGHKMRKGSEITLKANKTAMTDRPSPVLTSLSCAKA